MHVALLAHEKFPERAKTAVGILRYSDYEVEAVLDRSKVGGSVSDFISDSDVQDAPMVESLEDVSGIDALIIGIAPIGGGFDESWRADVCEALRRGRDVISGLHYFLSDDGEFARLADENDARIYDLRKPPDDLTVSDGIADEMGTEVILTVGTDCSVGKMTTTLELVETLNEHAEVEFVPTGQTGVMVDGIERDDRRGIVVDAVTSDFVAGAVERMVLQRADTDPDYIIVEGQGSIVHPAYSAVTCGILHGAMPDSLILCHEAGRETVHGYDRRLSDIENYVELYERIARPVHETQVVAGALNTSSLDEDEARDALDDFAAAVDAPATDPVRFGVEELVDAIQI
ncbi:MAG: DUF1611 domain-containing protein [Halobacteria archaeon]|nr:DUF1611 domain-containing protein [Halobacteria archaeon]